MEDRAALEVRTVVVSYRATVAKSELTNVPVELPRQRALAMLDELAEIWRIQRSARAMGLLPGARRAIATEG